MMPRCHTRFSGDLVTAAVAALHSVFADLPQLTLVIGTGWSLAAYGFPPVAKQHQNSMPLSSAALLQIFHILVHCSYRTWLMINYIDIPTPYSV
eukprot:m.173928 g.173928  ORF g.173928 m.173928 type:complete len:94 (+) comp10412_c0_seq3:2096-2377(+)